MVLAVTEGGERSGDSSRVSHKSTPPSGCAHLLRAFIEILEALPAIEPRTADRTFSPVDVVRELRMRGSKYSERTIRTHVVSRMNRDRSRLHHAVVYDDLERVTEGRYRRVRG